MKSKKSRPGFTLVELLTVLAIIGILASILFPTIGGALERAKRQAVLKQMTSIAVDHYSIAVSTPKPKPVGITKRGKLVSNLNEWAVDLARKGGTSIMSKMYFAGNYEIIGELPQIFYNDVTDTADEGFMNARLAYNVVAGMRSNPKTPSAVTLLWTADADGIFKGGNWEIGAPWDNNGGHVVYLDGVGEWFGNTKDNPFTHYKTRETEYDPNKANPSILKGGYEKVVGPIVIDKG